MTLFQLFFFLNLGLCTLAWETNKEYKYEVRGRVITGFHQVKDQFSGVLLKAMLYVQQKPPSCLIMKLKDANFAPVHAQLSRGWSTFIRDDELEYKTMPMTDGVFELTLNNGVIESLRVRKDLPNWEINFIKALASQFQLDTRAENFIKSRLNDVKDNSRLFKVMEDTISGIVETIYDITPISPYILQTQAHLAPLLNHTNDVFEIIKTKNFTNSRHLPSYHFGFNKETGWEPASNEMGNFLSRSSNSRVVISGSTEKFVLQSSVTTDKLVIAPHFHNTQKGLVASAMNVTLRGIGLTSNISLGNDTAVYGLTYEYFKPEQSIRKTRQSWSHDRYSIDRGYESSRNEISVDMKNATANLRGFYENPSLNLVPILPFSPFEFIQENDWTGEIKEMSYRIGENIYKADWFMKPREFFNFNTLVEMIRRITSEQITGLTGDIYFSHSKASHFNASEGQQYQAWMVFRDAVAEAGTGPALMAISDWISSGKIEGEEAAEVVAALPRTARYPNLEYMETFYDIATKGLVTSQAVLNTSAIMSFAELLKKLQSHESIHRMYPVHSYGSLKPEYYAALNQKFSLFMANSLQEAVASDDSSKAQVYIFALGTLSDPTIIPVISPYFEGRNQISDFLRLSIVAALQSSHKNFTRLYEQIYKNEGEISEIRVAAVLQLMNSNPSTALLQRMAEFTNYEHSRQVNSVVKSALESIAGLSLEDDLVNSAKAATPLLAPWEYGFQYSKHYRRTFEKNRYLGYDAQLSYIESEDSTTPSSMFYSLWKNMGGFRPAKFEIKAMSSSFKQLIKLIEEQFTQGDEVQSKNITSSTWSFEKINKILNLTTNPPRKVEGSLRVNWMGGNRLFTFDRNTITQFIPQWARFSGSYFRESRNFNFTKYHNQMSLRLGFPTAAGFPFWYSFDAPTVAYLGGQVQGKAHPDPNFSDASGQIPRPKTLNSTSDIIMIYSTRSEGQMGFMTPFDNKMYAAKLDKTFLLHLPAKFAMDADGENNNIRMSIEPLRTDRYVQLFEYSTRAYTFHCGIANLTQGDYGNVTLVQVEPTRKEFSIGKKKTGFSFDVKAQTEGFFDWATINKAVEGHDALSLLLYPSETSSNNFTVWFNPHQTTSHRAKITIDYRDVRNASELEKIPKFHWAHARQERQDYFLGSVLRGIKDGHARMIDVSLEFEGRKTMEYATTFALADSLVSPLTKMLFFAGEKSVSSTNSTQHYEILLQGNVTMPKVPLMNLKKALMGNPTSQIMAEVNFGDKNNHSKITLQGKMSRSDARVQYLQNKPIASQCIKEMNVGNHIQPACRNMTARALFLDRYIIKSHFENLPETLGTFFIKLYNTVRPYFFFKTEEAIVNSKKNELQLKFDYGKSLHSVNITLDSPKIQAKLSDVPINPYIRPILGVHPEYGVAHRIGQKLMKSQHFPVCVMDKNMATSFDNRSYPINLGQCWHVMTHRVSDSSRDFKNFSVLLRETGPDEKEILFILGRDIIELKSNRVKLNGRNLNLTKDGIAKVYDADDQLVAQIREHFSESIRIETVPSLIELMYDGARVKLLMSNQFRGELRGLCGTFDGEKINDFTSPRNCILRQPYDFTASYALADSTCQSQAREIHRQSLAVPCFKRIFLHGPVETEEDHPSQGLVNDTNDIHSEKDNSVGCIDHKIQIIENDGKTCFSLLPQIICKSHCRPSSQIQKTVDFHCINDGNVAKRWVQMVKKGANPEFNQGGPNHKATIVFPERCSPSDQLN